MLCLYFSTMFKFWQSMCLFCLLHFGFALHSWAVRVRIDIYRFFSFVIREKKGSFEGRYVFPVLWGCYFLFAIFLFAKKDRSFLSWVTGDGCPGCCESMLSKYALYSCLCNSINCFGHRGWKLHQRAACAGHLCSACRQFDL